MNNDIIIISSIIVAWVIIFLFGIYGGVHDNLANSYIGSVYNFRYFQPLNGTYDRHLAMVTSIRKLTHYDIERLNYSKYRMNDENFHRSNTLVTCKMLNGDIRQFYAERTTMCKRTIIGKIRFMIGV